MHGIAEGEVSRIIISLLFGAALFGFVVGVFVAVVGNKTNVSDEIDEL